MPARFSVRTRGIDELYGLVYHYLPKNLRGIAAEAVADDLIGDGYRGLKHYPRYRYVTRRRAYGKTFFSPAQQRYVMARIRSGRIDPGFPHRTGNYQRSWHREGKGVQSRIVGELPHEGFPSRHEQMVGWRSPDEIIETNLAHASIYAERRIQDEIDKKGYG